MFALLLTCTSVDRWTTSASGIASISSLNLHGLSTLLSPGRICTYLYLTFRSSRHVAHISGYLGYLPTYLFICPSARLSASQRKLIYPIAYSVQRTAYTYVPRRYVYLPSFSPHLLTRPSNPIQSHPISHILLSHLLLSHLLPFFHPKPNKKTRRVFPKEFLHGDARG